MNGRELCMWIAAILFFASTCAAAASASVNSTPADRLWHAELIHDRMTLGAHPEFRWHENLVSWFTALDGFMAGLPDHGWGSAVISDVRFDARSDTVMMIARIDRNEMSRFALGYTPNAYWMNTYHRPESITLGVMIGDDGSIRPVWTRSDAGYEPGLLAEGIYDIRIMLDRLSGTCGIEADEVESYDAPLSSFLAPAWTESAGRAIDEVLYIQICPYNHLSAVYDVWSTLPNPSLLRMRRSPDAIVRAGETVIVPTAAEYDGSDPLVWTFGDGRFSRVDTAFIWETGPGDGGMHEALLSVSDGYLLDTATVRYAVTHVYHEPVLHDRMNGMAGSPFEWTNFFAGIWFTGRDGYLGWINGEVDRLWGVLVANLEEPLTEPTAWVFRVQAGAGNGYLIGLTRTPSHKHTGGPGLVTLGVKLEGDGLLYPAFGTIYGPPEGTRLAAGIHDIRIEWDPAVNQVCFDVAPVEAWVDTLSDFSASTWSLRAYSSLSPPVWVQVGLVGHNACVYDVWRMPAPYRPSALLSRHAAVGRIDGVALEWSFNAPPEGEACVVMRSTEIAGFYETIVRLPLVGGMSDFNWFDDQPRPGATFTYRIYLASADVLELLFDTGPVTVPIFPAALYQNYPNPFNPATTIGWYFPESARARIKIYDVAGRIVRRLFDGRCIAGINHVHWDGRDDAGREAASGVYFYRIVAGDFGQARKMVLLR